ncbi:MAG: hypothetical protein WBC04_03105 [Candidatus Acidiferrales bacterium]
MKMMRSVFIPLVMTLLFAPLIHAQDLSRYRKFSLGTSLADLSKQVGPYSHETTLAHQRPAVIQEVTFWPLSPSRSAVGLEPVSQILFSFYNRELYRILVTYDGDAIQGLTDDDMVKAISARYGTATRYYPEINFPTNDVYAPTHEVIARWQDSQSSVNLFRSSLSDSFELLIFSKQVNAQAENAIAESVKLDLKEGPQMEFDRQQKEANDLEVARQKNIKTFRP